MLTFTLHDAKGEFSLAADLIIEWRPYTADPTKTHLRLKVPLGEKNYRIVTESCAQIEAMFNNAK